MKRVAAGLVIVISVFAMTVAAAAAADTPGSEADPVVTKSYVDSQIAQIKSTGRVFKYLQGCTINCRTEADWE